LFANTWRALHGSAGYRYRDLAADPVPSLNTAYCTLGRRVERHGLVPPARVAALVESPTEKREWALTRPLITELLAADTVLIGAPMYNFSVPAALKA
jgi:FMN-dependent NADH-azoreductase